MCQVLSSFWDHDGEVQSSDTRYELSKNAKISKQQSCTDTVEISRDVDRVLCVVHLFFGALPRHLKIIHAAEAYIFDFRSEVVFFDDAIDSAVADLH